MGRKKIKIEKISQPKNRQVTFNKRKVGLMKKAMELSILCDCDIALVVFSSDSKLFQYSSMNIDSIWQRYLEYDGPYESLSNDDLDLLKPGKASSFKVGTRKRKRPVGGVMPTPNFGDDDDECDEDDADAPPVATRRKTTTRANSASKKSAASSQSSTANASPSSHNTSQHPMGGAAALMAAAHADSMQSMDSVSMLGQAMAAAAGSSALISPSSRSGVQFPHGLAFQSPVQPPNLLGTRTKFKKKLTVQIPPKKGMPMLEVGGGTTRSTPIRGNGIKQESGDGGHDPLLTPHSGGRVGSIDSLNTKQDSIGSMPIGQLGSLGVTTPGQSLQSPSSFFQEGGNTLNMPFSGTGGFSNNSLMTPGTGNNLSNLSPFGWNSNNSLSMSGDPTRRSPLNSGATALRSPSAQALLSRSAFGPDRTDDNSLVKSEK